MRTFLVNRAAETNSFEIREHLLDGLAYDFDVDGRPATADPSVWPGWLLAVQRATAADAFTRNHHNRIDDSDRGTMAPAEIALVKLSEVEAFGAMLHFLNSYASPPEKEDIDQVKFEVDYIGFDRAGSPMTSDPASWPAWLDAVRSVAKD